MNLMKPERVTLQFLIVGVLVVLGNFLRPLSRLLCRYFNELFKSSVIDNVGFSGTLFTKSIKTLALNIFFKIFGKFNIIHNGRRYIIKPFKKFHGNDFHS